MLQLGAGSWGTGVAHLQVLPLAQRPEQGDLLLVAGRNAENLVPAGSQSHQQVRGDTGKHKGTQKSTGGREGERCEQQSPAASLQRGPKHGLGGSSRWL